MGFKHKIKVCSYLGEEKLIDGSKIRIYDKPKAYSMSLNTVSGYTELQLFGDVANRMVKAMVDINLAKIIKERDVAYLFEATNDNEEVYGENANYEVVKILPQNIKAVIYFEKINK